MNWADNKDYKACWIKEGKSVGAGGQGEGFKVKNKNSGELAFLKVIKSSKDKERRARFFLEASAFHAIKSEGVPRLIESNAHQHEDLSFTPYIVTEFLAGKTLSNWRDIQSCVEPDVAVASTMKLAEIVMKCHSVRVIHRDIKPDNIILLDDRPECPYLIDFGLNYHDYTDRDLMTSVGQEVGNRFLRLPELSAGSLDKQDPRSDLAFTAGILFYLITGSHPDVLLDGRNRMPHQREELTDQFRKMNASHKKNMMAFFDNCFAYQPEKRYPNMEFFINKLDQILLPEKVSTSVKDDFNKIQSLLTLPAEKQKAESLKAMKEASNQVALVFNKICSSLNGNIVAQQINYEESSERCLTSYAWTKTATDEAYVLTTVKTVVNGSQVIISFGAKEIHRTSVTPLIWNSSLKSDIETDIMPRLLAALNDPQLHIPEQEYFKENQPYLKLADARLEAEKKGKWIIAFVYDDKIGDRKNFNWALRYFLWHQETRALINDNFITALVPLSDISIYSHKMSGSGMLNGRCVLLNAQLDIESHDGMNGNPEDSELIIRNFISLHKIRTRPENSAK
ncbi:protein kinase [Pantoea sp. DY-17]|uniref:serine/threonine protein kinase n=1 Tax=Pantoea sp. DY-17 TaxID=2871490 RepID=UPI001C9566B8|nr:protein kinase [Pantoea sp. DY-17]MBY4954577.1 protein kinase [Pantoea sp. DY-17]